MTTDPNKPAFPIPDLVNGNGDVQPGSIGMTYREVLVKDIAAGMAASSHWSENVTCGKRPTDIQAMNGFAESAIAAADAIIAALNAGGSR